MPCVRGHASATGWRISFSFADDELTVAAPKPELYDSFEWADPVGAGATADGVEAKFRARLAKKPKDRITKSVSRCGWVFSQGRPDPQVIYSGTS